ncbi:MAG: hypothetical protein ABFS38_16420, partial [Bacteroidota bacterium]
MKRADINERVPGANQLRQDGMVNLNHNDQPMKNQHENISQWFIKRGFIQMIILFTILISGCKNE